MKRLFFYGTLKSGHPNNGFLAHSKAIFVGPDKIPGQLFTDGSLPYAKQNGEGEITGELWDCPEALVERLDRLEGHPMWYKRTTVTTAKGEQVETYYFQFPDRPSSSMRHIISGTWEGYRAHRA